MLLARYNTHFSVFELLKHYYPYPELVPSTRRSLESLVTIPLPLVQVDSRLGNYLLRNVSEIHELVGLPFEEYCKRETTQKPVEP